MTPSTKSAVQQQDNDDFVIVDDIDLFDETELRQMVAEVEALAGTPTKRIRVSILTADQWDTVLNRWLPAAQRRAVAQHTHALRDPTDPQHLVVSPSGIRGINERQTNIYEEFIYWLLRCLPTPLEKGALRSGVDDLVARLAGEKIGVEIYARHAPHESALVRGLAAVNVKEHGHTEADWVLLLRRYPERFFLALRKTSFMPVWLAEAKKNPGLVSQLEGAENKRAALIEMLKAEGVTASSPIFKVTESTLINYLNKS